MSDKTERDGRQALSAEQYRVCRKKGTEPAFSGCYWDTKTAGVYRRVACGEPLFSSRDKYDAGSGWPSFCQPLAAESVGSETDRSRGMARTEVHCRRCGSHLGHLFPDGPQPTGVRYGINSVSLQRDEDGD